MDSSDFISRRVRGLAAGAMLALSSCTLLFDPGNLSPGDGDGGPGGPSPDAFVPMGDLELLSLEPDKVYEGEGAAWPVPVIVRGRNIAPNATIQLTGSGFSATPAQTTVSADNTMIAFPLTVPVLESLRAGQTDSIELSVRSGDDVRSFSITIQGLDELDSSDVPERPLQATDFAPLYSRINIDKDLELIGSEPIRLVATAEIVLDASLDARGKPGVGGGPGQGGPGGCAGGEEGMSGGCGPGGGVGNGDDGPGGGGHFTAGTPGGGSPANPGGMQTGRPEMVPLEDERGNGGGGALDVAGGGGGGIVELTSHGTFTVEKDGRIDVSGGDGADGVCSGAINNGSGAGGSGGAILVRAFGGFVDESESVALLARGGTGGELGPDTGCVQVGGAGSFGRMRVDSPGNGLPPFALTAQPTPFRGPVFHNRDGGGNPISVVVEQPMLTLELVGQPNHDFFVDVNDGTLREPFGTSASGTDSVQLQLTAGINRLCAVMDQATPLGLSEGVQCISIAYIP
jgi:hypothetical protein